MKKIFSFISALALALPMLAGTVTFEPSNFNGQGISGGKADGTSVIEVTKAGVTFNCTNGFGAGSAVRCYKNAVITITSETTISKLNFTFESASQYRDELTEEIEVNATSWTHTLATSQLRFTELIVTIEGEGEGEVVVDTISVSEALARIEAQQLGKVYVKGQVMTIYTNNVETYGNISYWLRDLENENDSIQAYRMKGADNTDYATASDVEFMVGDDILVYGAGLSLYQKDDTTFIPEINTGYYVRTLRGAEIIDLDWELAGAYRAEGKWTINVTADNSLTSDFINFVFLSEEPLGIAGYHTLDLSSGVQYAGEAMDAIAGNVKFTYTGISNNGYNLYNVEAALVAEGKAFRMNKVLEIYAEDENGEEIVLTADRPFVPEEGEEITCAQAREYTLGQLASGETSTMSVVVVGYITDLFSNGVTFWMDDEPGSTDVHTFEAYKVNEITPLGVGLQNGAKVKVTGYLTNYGGTTPEISGGSVEIIEGGKIVTVISATVAEAIAVAEALEPGKTTDETYAIDGYVGSIVTEYSDQYKNISFWMVEQPGSNNEVFQAYRAKCDESIASQIVEGAHVVVTGNIQHFHQDATTDDEGNEKPERTIFEVINGTVTIYGTAVDTVTGEPIEVIKRIENGQIILMINGTRYNINGQKAE